MTRQKSIWLAFVACGVTQVSFAQILTSNVPIIDSLTGGTQHLTIQASSPAVSWYWVVGSDSGTAPGTVVAPGVLLPLNFDPFTTFTLANANGPILQNTFGATGAGGIGSANIVVPPLAASGAIALDLAFVQLDPVSLAITGASNSVPLLIQPNVPPYITASKSSAAPGETIEFQTQNGFDITQADDDTDFCVVFMPDATSNFAPGQWIGLDVVQVDAAANKLVAKVPLWFDVNFPLGTVINGKIGMAKGEGNAVRGMSAGFITKKIALGWSWEKTVGGADAMMVLPFQMVAANPIATTGVGACIGPAKKVLYGFREFNVGPNGEDAWCIVIPNPNLPGNVAYECFDQFTIRPRFWSDKNADGTPAPMIGYDADIGCHEINDDFCVTGDKFSPGLFGGDIATLILDTYIKHVPPIDIEMLAVQNDGNGGKKLCFYIGNRDLSLTAGQFSITLYD